MNSGTISVSTETYLYLVSVSGAYNKISFVNVGLNMSSILKLFWMKDSYRLFEHVSDEKCSRNFLTVLQYSYCRNFSFHPQRRKHYLYFRKYFEKAVFPAKKQAKVTRSWVEARGLCRAAGGHLPLISSKEDLHELMTIIKMSSNIQLSRHIFIGLIHKVSGEVSNPTSFAQINKAKETKPPRYNVS